MRIEHNPRCLEYLEPAVRVHIDTSHLQTAEQIREALASHFNNAVNEVSAYEQNPFEFVKAVVNAVDCFEQYTAICRDHGVQISQAAMGDRTELQTLLARLQAGTYPLNELDSRHLGELHWAAKALEFEELLKTVSREFDNLSQAFSTSMQLIQKVGLPDMSQANLDTVYSACKRARVSEMLERSVVEEIIRRGAPAQHEILIRQLVPAFQTMLAILATDPCDIEDSADTVVDVANQLNAYLDNSANHGLEVHASFSAMIPQLQVAWRTSLAGGTDLLNELDIPELNEILKVAARLEFADVRAAIELAMDRLATAHRESATLLQELGPQGMSDAQLQACADIFERCDLPADAVEQEIESRGELHAASTNFIEAVDAVSTTTPENFLHAVITAAARFRDYGQCCEQWGRRAEAAALRKREELFNSLPTRLVGPLALNVLKYSQLLALSDVSEVFRFPGLQRAVITELANAKAAFEVGAKLVKDVELKNIGDAQLEDLKVTFARHGDSLLLHAVQRELQERQPA